MKKKTRIGILTMCLVLAAQALVVAENAIMGQGEGGITNLPGEGVIVCVEPLAALGGHTGVAHDEIGVLVDLEPQQMGRQGTLVDFQIAAGVVSDTGCIRTPFLAGYGQNGQDLGLFLTAQLVTVVQNSKQTAHTHTS